LFLTCSSNALAVIKSGDITYASPNPLNCEGSAENVTVRIVNTGDDGDMIIRPDSVPSGWNVSPPSRNVFLPSGGIYYATFSVTPPPNNSSGTLVWKLYYDNFLLPDTLLDTYVQTVFNTMPVQIDYILPNPAQPPGNMVQFRGTGGNYAVQWEWKSNLDGILSTVEDFDKSSYQMTVGSHIIEFRVRHSHTGYWSAPDIANLTINNALPTALPPIGLPGVVLCGSTICLGLGGYDNDENGYTIVQREVSIVGIGTYTTSSDNLCFPAPTAPGSYQLRYRVQDDEGSWSNYFTNDIQVVSLPIISPIHDEISSEQYSYVGPTPTLVQGSTPITWSLVEGPNDMWIDNSSGIVQWDEPNMEGSPHTITIRATNSDGYDDETWLLTISFSDFDNSGKVNFGDFAILAYYWMDYTCSEPDWCEGCDYDKDTYVDINDLKVFTEDWLWEY